MKLAHNYRFTLELSAASIHIICGHLRSFFAICLALGIVTRSRFAAEISVTNVLHVKKLLWQNKEAGCAVATSYHIK